MQTSTKRIGLSGVSTGEWHMLHYPADAPGGPAWPRTRGYRGSMATPRSLPCVGGCPQHGMLRGAPHDTTIAYAVRLAMRMPVRLPCLPSASM
jgi:hypothetical protein